MPHQIAMLKPLQSGLLLKDTDSVNVSFISDITSYSLTVFPVLPGVTLISMLQLLVLNWQQITVSDFNGPLKTNYAGKD